MQKVLIIRFGSLGDLCLLAWSLSRWARGAGAERRQVTLVTKAAFAPLMAKMHGIDRVIALPNKGGGGALVSMAKKLRAENFDTIIDAHSILRGHLLLAMMGRQSQTRLQKDTVARLVLLGFGYNSAKLKQTMVQRFDALLTPIGPLAAHDSPAPLPFPDDGIARLALAPGAQWDSKRWPEESFAQVLEDFRLHHDSPVRVFLGPREERWYSGSRLEAAAKKFHSVEVYRDTDLIEVAELLAGCNRVLTNDSGLLHVAEAVGTPVVAFFGPTVRQFGYFPRLAASRVLEVELDCRPCSRNGKKPCHRGDLACLRPITAQEALDQLAWPTTDSESAP